MKVRVTASNSRHFSMCVIFFITSKSWLKPIYIIHYFGNSGLPLKKYSFFRKNGYERGIRCALWVGHVALIPFSLVGQFEKTDFELYFLEPKPFFIIQAVYISSNPQQKIIQLPKKHFQILFVYFLVLFNIDGLGSLGVCKEYWPFSKYTMV